MNLRFVAVALALSCWVGPALGDSDADAARRAFDEGRALFTQGRYAEACPKLEESLRLAPELRTQYGLADCYEKLGRLASAWKELGAVARAAAAAGNSEQEKFALERADALEPRLVRLTITVPSQDAAIDDFIVLDNQHRVERADWGRPVPVDPGAHHIEVSAKGRKPWSRDLDVPTEGTSLRIEVPLLEPSEAPKVEQPALPQRRPHRSAARPRRAPEPETSNAQRLVGIVVGGAGLATLGAGVVVGLSAKSRFSDSSSHCQGNLCDPEGLAIRDQAYNRGTVATVLSIAGGALAAGGAVLFFTAPSGREHATGPKVSLGVSANAARMGWSW